MNQTKAPLHTALDFSVNQERLPPGKPVGQKGRRTIPDKIDAAGVVLQSRQNNLTAPARDISMLQRRQPPDETRLLAERGLTDLANLAAIFVTKWQVVK